MYVTSKTGLNVVFIFREQNRPTNEYASPYIKYLNRGLLGLIVPTRSIFAFS